MRLLIPIVLVAGVVAGCSARLPAPSQPAVSGQASVRPAVGPSAPATALDPAWLTARVVTCDGELFFSPALLQGPGEETAGVDRPAELLRAFLAGLSEDQDRAVSGWHRVAQTATRVQFVAVRPSGKGLMVVGFMFVQGAWQLDLAGACAATVQRPAGLERADWWLDPDFPAPRPTDRLLHGRLMELACASGKSPEGRLAPPAIEYLDGAVVVTMSVRSRAGAQDCPGNPEFPFEIPLDQPLGDRQLLDGGTFPPRDASTRPA